MNSDSFYSQKFPSVGDTLYDHLSLSLDRNVCGLLYLQNKHFDLKVLMCQMMLITTVQKYFWEDRKTV